VLYNTCSHPAPKNYITRASPSSPRSQLTTKKSLFSTV